MVVAIVMASHLLIDFLNQVKSPSLPREKVMLLAECANACSIGSSVHVGCFSAYRASRIDK